MMIDGRRIKFHEAFANSFVSSCKKTLIRELTSDEIDVLKSSTLCCSGMMLESIDRYFQIAKVEQDIEEQLRFLTAQVKEYEAEVRAAMMKFATSKNVTSIEAESNLLDLERSIYAKL